MNRNHAVIGAFVITSCLAALDAGGDIPPRPEDLTFAPLDFNPPTAGEFRSELPGGIPIYMAPSSEFPL